MRLEDMLKNVSGITNRVIKENCWEGQFNVLEGIQVLQSKINEIILAINNGIIKGDKGDTPNVQVGSTETLEPGNNASVTQTGDMLNPILNFSIPKGDKGDKGDTGKASESIQDNIVGLDTCWSSQKTVGYVDNMFNSLQDVKGVKYETDKDYFVASGSKNGVVKDLKLYGKSLVNKYPKLGGINVTTSQVDSWPKLKMGWGGTTTIVNCSDKTILINFNRGADYVTTLTFNPYEVKKINYDSEVSISQVVGQFENGWSESNKSDLQKILVFQGDIINPPVAYFEGIASVGNGKEIDVLSRKEDGNLFDGIFVNGSLNASTGTITPTTNGRCIEKIPLLPNTEYDVKMLKGESDRRIVTFFDSMFNVISYVTASGTLKGFSFTTPVNCRYATIYVGQNINSLVEELVLNRKGCIGTEHKQDKKPILFKDVDGAWKPVTELRGIIDSTYDTIENSKYNKKIDEIVLDETLNYTLWKPNPNAVNTIMFSLPNLKIKRGSQYSPISNLLVNRIGVPKEPISTFKNLDKEGIGYWDSSVSLFVSINKSQLETPDVEGFKKLLKKWNDEGQPLKVIYEKEAYEQYEVNPLDLQSFENETMLLFKYGIVNGTSEFYIDSNLGSITLENMKRLSRIENEIYQVKKVVLNGDYRTLAQSTYPEDFKEVVKYE